MVEILGNLSELQDNIDMSTNFIKIHSDRIIIDEAITHHQLEQIMKYLHFQEEVKNNSISISLNNAGDKQCDKGYDPAKPLRPDYQEKYNFFSDETEYMKYSNTLIEIDLAVMNYCTHFFGKPMDSTYLSGENRVRRTSIQFRTPNSECRIDTGWVLAPHIDACEHFDEESWSCTTSLSSNEKSPREISAILFLNDLLPEEAGELMFIDSLTHNVSYINTVSTQNSGAPKKIKSPSRETIMKAWDTHRSDQERIYNSSSSSTSSSTSQHKSRIFATPKSLYIPHNIHTNHRFTLIPPKARRLVLFNSSDANVHAVTDLLSTVMKSKSQRFVYLTFLAGSKYQ